MAASRLTQPAVPGFARHGARGHASDSEGILIAGSFCYAEHYFIAQYFQLQEFCKPTFPALKIPYWRRKTLLFSELIVCIRVEKTE
ncbi:hypothetical protein FP026_16525 [Rhizobium tropici]|uniref:Uncharacterized protein n=1 Tax=Rhizobium tropici TaxID=398 RepID=A0A5B0W0Z9_RHITR|nr:hypothetical protein [Rhizobium tropici]KAA1180434.1 hypothetical protein FP026_16525 [Rhizobium tropici]